MWGYRRAWRVFAVLGAVVACAASVPADSTAYSVYVVNGSSSFISQYDANSSTGALTPKTPATAPTISGRRSIVITPDGRHVYVMGTTGLIEMFDVGSNGTLAAHTPATAASGIAGSATDFAVSPNGRNLYVSSTYGEIARMQIAADGTLTQVPDPVIASTDMAAIVVSPDGQHVVTMPGPTSLTPAPQQWDVDANGELSNPTALPGTAQGAAYPPSSPGPPLFSTTGGMAATPNGAFAYAADTASHAVTQFSASPFTPLTPASYSLPAGAFPYRVAISPDGKHLYTTDGGPAGTSVYQLDIATNGTLSQIASPVGAGTAPRDVAVSPDQPPVASFIATAGLAGTVTSFDGSGSTAPGSSITRYDWTFGDGASAADAGPSPSHVYAAPGTYEARLTVTSANGCGGQYVGDGNTTYCNGSPATITTTRQVVVGSQSGGGDDACAKARAKLAKAKKKLKALKKKDAKAAQVKKAKKKVKKAKSAVKAACS